MSKLISSPFLISVAEGLAMEIEPASEYRSKDEQRRIRVETTDLPEAVEESLKRLSTDLWKKLPAGSSERTRNLYDQDIEKDYFYERFLRSDWLTFVIGRADLFVASSDGQGSVGKCEPISRTSFIDGKTAVVLGIEGKAKIYKGGLELADGTKLDSGVSLRATRILTTRSDVPGAKKSADASTWGFKKL